MKNLTGPFYSFSSVCNRIVKKNRRKTRITLKSELILTKINHQCTTRLLKTISHVSFSYSISVKILKSIRLVINHINFVIPRRFGSNSFKNQPRVTILFRRKTIKHVMQYVYNKIECLSIEGQTRRYN